MKTTIIGRMSLIGAAFLTSVVAASGQIPEDRLSGSRFEASTVFGAMIAGKEFARGINATGGEQLIARLGHGGAL